MKKNEFFLKNLLTLFFVLGIIIFVGGHREVVLPVPIPNTEVKHLIVDDTPNRGKVERCQLFFILNDILIFQGRLLWRS